MIHLLDLGRAAWKDLWSSRILRFLVVGGVNTVFGYSIFALIYFISQDHDLALLISVALGVVFNFFAIGNVVFRTLPKGRFLLFCLNYGIALLVNSLMLNILVSMGVGVLIGQFICLPTFIAVSYSLNAHFVFRQSGSGAKQPLGSSTDSSPQ